jgi:hypothetical protein
MSQEKKSVLENTATKSLVGFGLGSGLVLGTNLVTAKIISGVVGFGAKGVAAGSIAAAKHAVIGSVAAGSKFALFQKMGALGYGIFGTAVWPVAIVTGLTVSGYTLYKQYQPKQISNEKINMSA